MHIGAGLRPAPHDSIVIGANEYMPKRRKRFSAATEARRRARLAAGPPPAERVIPDKRLKPPKHKKPPLDVES